MFEGSVPPGARLEWRGDGYTATVSTRSKDAWKSLLYFIAWALAIVGWLSGSDLSHGRRNVLEFLVGIPLLVGATVVGWGALMRQWGQLSVSRHGDDGVIEQGVGPLGKTRRFRWSEVTKIEVVEEQKVKRITLRRAAGDMDFGLFLSDEAREFLLAVSAWRPPQQG